MELPMLLSGPKAVLLGIVSLFTVLSPSLHAQENFSIVPDQIDSSIFEKAEKNFGITGSFIQIMNPQLALSKEQWLKEVKALHSLGNKTLIIQYAAFNDSDFVP